MTFNINDTDIVDWYADDDFAVHSYMEIHM